MCSKWWFGPRHFLPDVLRKSFVCSFVCSFVGGFVGSFVGGFVGTPSLAAAPLPHWDAYGRTRGQSFAQCQARD